MREQHMKLFVFAGVPMDTHFEPRTRKEISKIEWYKLSELPTLKKAKQQQYEGQEPSINGNKFYMVAPFLRRLKTIISELRKQNGTNNHRASQETPIATPAMLEPQETPEHKISSPPDTSGDMDRLMAQLRQSKQASRENSFPEVSHPVEAAKDASAQLKTFPSVPRTGSTVQSDAHHDSAAARETKASAMLSLLRSGSNGALNQLTKHEPPQTPFEQIFGQPSQPPPSPKRHPLHTPREPKLPPPPSFPFPSSQSENHVMANQSSPLLHQTTNWLQSQNLSHQRLNLQPPAQIRLQQPQLSQASAPYQRTGDPQFAQAPLSASTGLSLIPPASKLPPPKLTSHSSTLLSLFKGNDDKQDAPLHATNMPPMDNGPRLELSASSPLTSTKPQHLFNGPKAIKPPEPRPVSVPSSFTIPPQESPQRSSQQEALLDLFKSSTNTAKPSPSLAPPIALAELSATQSPTHTRASSALDKSKDKTPTPKPLVNGRVTIQKRPNGSPTTKQAKVSATVTGPLNVPQFDKVPKKSFQQKGKVENTRLENVDSSLKLQQPIKVLSRPGTANKPNQDFDIVKSISPKPSRARESPRRPKRPADPKDSPKPFQPQILKRPVETPPPAPKEASPRPIPTLITRDTFLLEGQSSQTQEQKNTLLSLFGKSSPITPANPTPFAESLVSPLSAKPPPTSSMPSPIGTVARSRIGSLTSLAEDGLGSLSLTPKAAASPVDKKFLLGFLDGVAKEGRR